MAYYWRDMRTRCLCSFGFCPTPFELQDRCVMRQLEHGELLSQRICQVRPKPRLDVSQGERNVDFVGKPALSERKQQGRQDDNSAAGIVGSIGKSLEAEGGQHEQSRTGEPTLRVRH